MSRSSVVVIGLDGVPYSLLSDLTSNGTMPQLKSVIDAGVFLPMTTSLPPVSSVAWTSFMTGRNPGGHGIFGFTDVRHDRLALKLPSYDDVCCPTIWNVLSHRRSAIVNLPFTYPARPLNGVLIAGFVVPIFERSVFPRSLLPWLTGLGYKTDVDAQKGRVDRNGLIRELFEVLNIRETVFLQTLAMEPWDLFVGVVTGTDRLHHFFFDAADDPFHPFRSAFEDYYRRIDMLIGRALETASPDARVIVLSDHGFTRLNVQVYVNEILKSLGYLSFRCPSPRRLDDIDPGSKAFALDPTRIYINSQKRFPFGTVANGETVRSELKAALKALTVGSLGCSTIEVGLPPELPLFADVISAQDVYDADCRNLEPDLIVIPTPGIDPKAAIGTGKLFMKDIFTGMHTQDDAFLILNDQSRKDLPQPMTIDRVADLIYEKLL
jgi:predicted AlkP superfamily phosphohydrolase/phosphomutase